MCTGNQVGGVTNPHMKENGDPLGFNTMAEVFTAFSLFFLLLQTSAAQRYKKNTYQYFFNAVSIQKTLSGI